MSRKYGIPRYPRCAAITQLLSFCPTGRDVCPMIAAPFLIFSIVAFRRRYQEIGVDTIYLEVRESNEAAYQFYLKNGFEEYGRRAKYYKDPIEDAILMFCEISTDDQSFPLDSSETPVYNDERKEENEMKCNVCGQLLNNKTDYIEVKKEWGYFSNKDTQIHEFKICERCYDRIVKQFEISPKVTEKSEILS